MMTRVGFYNYSLAKLYIFSHCKFRIEHYKNRESQTGTSSKHID